ncbi:N-6 DNA methylase [Deinococcus marmoris]|nr:N-6 DNA methylase [Deinococcus marmoris]
MTQTSKAKSTVPSLFAALEEPGQQEPSAVPALPEEQTELAAFTMLSTPSRAPDTSGLPLGTEALVKASDAERVRANGLAREVAMSEGTMTPQATAALRAWSGEGNLGGSTSAFYTPGALAGFMWNVLEGLKAGSRALEFACGGGVFFEHAPQGTLLSGVEIDETTARVARTLYPHAHVHHAPFETYHTQSGDAPFDVVIGNPPFGVRGASAYRDRPEIEAAHWYFVLAGLERLQGGGLMAVIVPESMLRNPSEQMLRERLLDSAHLLCASAIPESAFRATGAGVSTALLILRRHDAGVGEAMKKLSEDERATLREARMTDDGLLRHFVTGTALFYKRNETWQTTYGFPRLGESKEETLRAGRFGDPVYGGPLHLDADKLETVTAFCRDRQHGVLTRTGLLSAVYTLLGSDASARAAQGVPQAHPIQNGQVSSCGRYRFARGGWQYADALNTPSTLSALNVARAVVAARAAVNRGGAQARRDEALQAHTAHLAQHGAYDIPALKKAARTLNVLGVLTGEGDVGALLAELPAQPLTFQGQGMEAVAQELEAYGMLSAANLSQHAGVTQNAAYAHLRAAYAYTGRLWEARSTYLRGNAHSRALHAEELSASASGQEREALISQACELRALAPWTDLSDMTLEARDPLIPESILSEWVNAALGSYTTLKRNAWDKDGERVGLLHAAREGGAVTLRIRNTLSGADNLEDRRQIEPGRVRALEAYLNFATPVGTVVNQNLKSPEQIAAERAAHVQAAGRWEKELAAQFRSFVLGGPYAAEIERLLNEGRYGLIPAQPDHRPLLLAGYSGPLAHPFQAAHVRTAARMDGAILNFDVGLGKTLTGLMLAALLLQSGRARTVAIVVPLSRLADWVMNARTALEKLNVVVIGGAVACNENGSFTLDENGEPVVRSESAGARSAKLARLLTHPPDVVILTLDAFEAVPMLEETRLRMIHSDPTLMAGADQGTTFDERSRKMSGHRKLSAVEKTVGRHLARVRVSTHTDLPWEVLGIGAIITDEVHALKNSYSAPTVYGESNPKFLGSGGESNRAIDAVHKYRFVRAFGGATVGLSATWFTNSPIEIFNQLALHTDALAAYGLSTVAAFTARFCVIESRLITLPDGEVEFKPCVVGFRNLPELRAIMAQHVIRETEDTCLMHTGVGMPLPPLETVEHLFDLPAEVMERYEEERGSLAEVESEGKMHLFSIFARMMKLTLHPPLLGVGAPSVRFAECVSACLKAREAGGRNVVFLSMGGKGGEAYSALRDMLIAGGYPAGEIETITASSHPAAGQRLGVERRLQRGELSCVIGSAVIEQGANFQGATDLHHLDYPHHSKAFDQRIGRARRQGTRVLKIRNHLYFGRDSFDMLRYQNMLGKKGWAEQVYDPSVLSCENSDAGFDGEELAVMLSRDPQAMRAQILKKKEERHQQTRAATLLDDAAMIREYLDTIRLLRSRHAAAQGREKGPSVHDKAGITRLVTALRTLHAGVVRLRAAGHPLSAVTRLKAAPVWAAGLPMHPGLEFTTGGVSYRVKLAESASPSVAVEELPGHALKLLAISEIEPEQVTPTRDEDAYGDEALTALPRKLREQIEAEAQPVAEVVAQPAAVAQPAGQAAPVSSEPMPITPPPARPYGLSVAHAARPHQALFSVVDDHLEAGALSGAAVFALEYRADQSVRVVTLIVPDPQRSQRTRQLLLARDTRLRVRVDALLATAV